MALTVISSPDFIVPDVPRTQRYRTLRKNLDFLDIAIELDNRCARRATVSELTHVHDLIYVLAAINGWSEEWVGRRVDMGAASLKIAGAALQAAAMIWRGTAHRVFIPAGGRVHANLATSDRLCVFNDVALAAKWLSRRRISTCIVDLDGLYAPQLEELLSSDPNVSVISVHDDTPNSDHDDSIHGIYNFTLDAESGDDALIDAVDRAIALIHGILPDVILLVAGASGHEADDLTSLNYTLDGIYEATIRVCRAADEICAGRMIAFGGAGSQYESVTPAIWTAVTHALDQTMTTAPVPPPAFTDNVRQLALAPLYQIEKILT